MNSTIKFSTFKSIKNTKPYVVEAQLETFIKGMTALVSNSAKNKNDLPLWSPCIFKEGGKRCKGDAEWITCLVYDIDDGATPFSTWQLFTEWNVIAHTSFSHKPQHHKYRVILPLGQPIPACDWDRAHLGAIELWRKLVGQRSITKDEKKDLSLLYRELSGEKSRAKSEIYSLKIWDITAGNRTMDPRCVVDPSRAYFRFALPYSEYAISHPLHPQNYHNFDGWTGGYNLVLEYDHIKLPEPVKRAPLDRSKPVSYNRALLETDVREKIAHKAGGKIHDNVARYITCPQCNRNTVHFYINIGPNDQKWARCNHVESCGWNGPIDELVL